MCFTEEIPGILIHGNTKISQVLAGFYPGFTQVLFRF